MSFERIVERVRENDVVLWIGSGFSLYAGMPSANDLREALINNSSKYEKPYFKNKNLSEVASTFTNIRNESKAELYSVLCELIDREPLSLEYHKLLAEIPQIDLIVTTNYDKLFEEAYGRDILSIVSNSQVPSAKEKVNLYKIHGDINMPKTIKITTEDYTNFFREQDNPLWNKVKTLLAEKTIIFIGYSMADQNIQYLFDNVTGHIGEFIKESFLIAPSMPTYEVNHLNRKGISYVDMTGEVFVERLHKEIKKSLLDDTIDNKINKKSGLSLLKEKYGLDATIKSNANGNYLEKLGLCGENKCLDLNMKFKNIDFFSLLKKSSSKPFTIAGEEIVRFESNFEGINIPNWGEIKSLTVIPQPLKKFKADLIFKEADIILSDVNIEVFKKEDSTISIFTHKFLRVELDSKDNSLNFKLNIMDYLRDFENIINFLLVLIKGQEFLVAHINEIFYDNSDIKGKDINIVKMNPIANSEIRQELYNIKDIISFLKEVQKHYDIIFRGFEPILSENYEDDFNNLRIHMKKTTMNISKLYFDKKDIIVPDNDSEQEGNINKLIETEKPFDFTTEREIDDIIIFGQTIKINEKLTINCPNAIITKVIDKTESLSELKLYSESDSMTMGFI